MQKRKAVHVQMQHWVLLIAKFYSSTVINGIKSILVHFLNSLKHMTIFQHINSICPNYFIRYFRFQFGLLSKKYLQSGYPLSSKCLLYNLVIVSSFCVQKSLVCLLIH